MACGTVTNLSSLSAVTVNVILQAVFLNRCVLNVTVLSDDCCCSQKQKQTVPKFQTSYIMFSLVWTIKTKLISEGDGLFTKEKCYNNVVFDQLN